MKQTNLVARSKDGKTIQAEAPVPAKLFYKIGEVCEITGIQSFVLRFWEKEFPQLGPKRNNGKQRVYTKKEIDRVVEIRDLLYKQGLTIAGARARLEGRIPLQAFPQNTLGQIKKELEEILTLLA